MYKKIILKLSGESLGVSGNGIDIPAVDSIVSAVLPVCRKGISVGIVTGGGNIWRGVCDGTGMDRTAADYAGMAATFVNGLVLKERFCAGKVPAEVFAPFSVGNFISQFTVEKVREVWDKKGVVIMTGGTGRPHFTTDTGAAVFAAETGAEVILKATDVEGVYDDDPRKNPHAKLLKSVSFDEAISRNLKIMDTAAFSICRQHGINIIVFNFGEKGNILKAASGSPVGSLVHP
jgi:uridylate kinase